MECGFEYAIAYFRPLLEFDGAPTLSSTTSVRGGRTGCRLCPPTPERVGEFLDYVGRSPSEILGTEPTKGRVITVEKVAINAVMAGCLPEYFPVVLAAVEALVEPQFNLHAITVSTMGAAVLAVVNGPIANDLAMNSAVSVFGPGHRANATIGRAIRLVIINVTGAVPGVLDKATLGHPGKYTWCIAEAEEVSPWEPLHVERGHGGGIERRNAVRRAVGDSGAESYREYAGVDSSELWGRDVRGGTRAGRGCLCFALSTSATWGAPDGARRM